MIETMILSLLITISNCIGNIWWIMNMHHIGIGCGMMVVLPNLRITSHGFLFQGIQIWLEVAKWCGISFVAVMGRGSMMGQKLWWKDFFGNNNSMFMVWSCKMPTRWLFFYMNNCLVNYNHLILVHESHYKFFYGMWKQKMLSGYFFCSFVILSKGQWRFIQFILWT
jgi:hypothetical protein